MNLIKKMIISTRSVLEKKKNHYELDANVQESLAITSYFILGKYLLFFSQYRNRNNFCVTKSTISLLLRYTLDSFSDMFT